MDEKTAKNLVDEMARHPEVIKPDKDLFVKVLSSINVPGSSKFYENLPDDLLNNSQLIQKIDRYHYLSLKRILRNYNAREHQLSTSGKILESIGSVFRVCDSDALDRNLRTNKDLIKMMAENKQLYSLLGEFQTYDFDNPDDKFFRITRPILVIPGVEDMSEILKWEQANSTFEKEIGNIVKRFKKIRLQEYPS